MSLDFGLHWKEEEFERMEEFILIKRILAQKQEQENLKYQK